MPETKVVNCRDDEYDIFIGRPTIWGNPYIIGVDGTREEVLELYEHRIRSKPQLIKLLHFLKGKTLGCPGNCKPLACHGDILIKLVNEFVL